MSVPFRFWCVVESERLIESLLEPMTENHATSPKAVWVVSVMHSIQDCHRIVAHQRVDAGYTYSRPVEDGPWLTFAGALAIGLPLTRTDLPR